MLFTDWVGLEFRYRRIKNISSQGSDGVVFHMHVPCLINGGSSITIAIDRLSNVVVVLLKTCHYTQTHSLMLFRIVLYSRPLLRKTTTLSKALYRGSFNVAQDRGSNTNIVIVSKYIRVIIIHNSNNL